MVHFAGVLRKDCMMPTKKTEPTDPPMSSDTGQTVLDKMLERIGKSREFPAISKYLFEINKKLSENPEASNASELANIILKDYALTNKILKLVNSAFYGLAAGKVTTITRAVVVLGYKNVRLATLSLALFEYFKETANTMALKEAVVGSFWLGTIARDIALKNHGIDPEGAFVCAMMSQLGKLLMIHYLPTEYRAIQKRVDFQNETETKAAKTVCGVTYEALGNAVARQWNFPGQLCRSMRIVNARDIQKQGRTIEPLTVLCNFVRELEAIVQKGHGTQKIRRIDKLLDRYRGRINIPEEELHTLIRHSMDKIRQHTQALDYSIEKSLFIEKLSDTVQLIQPEPPQDQPDIPPDISPDIHADSYVSGDEADIPLDDPPAERKAESIIMEGVQEISEALLADTDTGDVMVMSLEILYRSMEFQRALMFIHDKRRHRMEVRFGYGPNCHRLIGKTHFNITGNQDLFNFSIKMGKDLVVADMDDPKLSHLIPPWYRRSIGAPAFIFLPVLVQNVCMAAFYADRNQRGVPINNKEHRHLSMLRNQLVLAFKFRKHHD